MTKNRIKTNRVSVLKKFDNDLPSPEEITKKVEAVTAPKVEKPVKVTKQPINEAPQPTKKTLAPKKNVAKEESKVTSETEVIKFVKLGATFHRLAKIDAAKKSLSLKAYLEMLIEKHSSS